MPSSSPTTTINSSPTAAQSSSPSCITVTPDSDGYVPEYACNANYNYSPSFAFAILFSILFGLTLALHIFQAITYRKLRLCWVVIMCALWEFVSFALRAAGSKDQQSTGLAFGSQLLVLLAPLWLNAFDYMVLGRMIQYFVVPERRIWGIRARKLAVWFVCADILSFLTQLGGGSLIQNGEDASLLMTGIHIYMGGIGLQQLFILVFTAFALRFRTRMLRAERNGGVADPEQQYVVDNEGVPVSSSISSTDAAPQKKGRWDFLLYALLASLFLITVRIIYRLIEFSAGLDPDSNPLPFHEWFFYVFDAVPMLLALFIMNIFHPGRTLVGPESEFPKGPSRKEKKAAKMVLKEEKKAAKAEKKAEKTREKEVKKAIKQGRGHEINGADADVESGIL